jgi:hypothetical protein
MRLRRRTDHLSRRVLSGVSVRRGLGWIAVAYEDRKSGGVLHITCGSGRAAATSTCGEAAGAASTVESDATVV